MSRTGRPSKTKEPNKRKWYRPIDSYRANSPETKERQLSGLKQYSGKVKPKDPNAPAPLRTADLMKADIIEFATKWLGVSFAERPAQAVILRCLYGLPLDDAQIEIYRKLTTNDEVFEPDVEKTEADLAVGARGGKSFLVSVIALYESIVKADHWRKYLRPGETGYAIIVATRQAQAQDIIQASCLNLLNNSSILRNTYYESDKQERIDLKNGLSIVSMPCNSTAGRGLPIFLLINDELGHWRSEGVRADYKIHNALRPRQSQFPGAKCLKITTPAGKQGLFWDEFDEGFKVPGRLTIQADTRLVNPVIPQSFIDKEYKRDPDNAAREYGSQFAETTEGFFVSCMDQLLASFDLGEDFIYQLGQQYFASIDQSGLAGRDRFAFAIAHNESKNHKITVDVTREWATKDSDVIMQDIKALCSTYKIRKVRIDKYAAGWVQASLEKIGLTVEVRDKLAVIYTNFKTLALSEKLSLPDRPSLRNGLLRTQAFFSKSNSLSIQHERTSEGHGDIADAVVDAAYQASQDLTIHNLESVYIPAPVPEGDFVDAYLRSSDADYLRV